MHPAIPKPLIVPVFIPHQGCPHRCIFCNQSLITGSPKASLDTAAVRLQITRFLGGCRPGDRPVQIAFYGGNFLGLPPDRVTVLLPVAGSFASKKEGGGIRFSTRPDTINPESMAWLSPFPVRTVEIGAQSMDDGVLGKARRGHTAADTCRAAELVKSSGYKLGIQIMTGLPGDSEAVSMETACRVADLSPDFVRIYPTVVVKGSRLAAWYEDGTYMPWSLKETVFLVKEMFVFFEEKGIRVIRMGLQATEDLRQGDTILAGPYHPAFGHLVYSEKMFDRAVAVLSAKPKDPGGTDGGEATIRVNPRIESQLRGLNNENINRLKARFQLKKVTILSDPTVPEGEVLVTRNL